MTDKLVLGDYYSIDYLKNGTLHAPSLSNLFDLAIVADTTGIKVARLSESDTSDVYQVVKKPLSATGDGVVTTTYLSDYIVKGYVYNSGVVKTVTDGTEYYVIDPTLCDCNVFKQPISIVCSAGTAILRLYEGTNYSISTQLGMFNRNRTSENTAKIKFGNASVAGTTKGTEIQDLLFGTDGTRQSAGGGIGGGSNSIILSNKHKYLLEVTYSEDCTVGLSLEVVEV